MSDYDVSLVHDNLQEFNVVFPGPKDTPYENGKWTIHVELPNDYPYKSPSIGFRNKIYHPNIDEASGSVCLDVINQTWSPMFDMLNIFDVFLPQLLTYPNAADPLNGDASQLYNESIELYEQKIKEYVKKYALPAGVEDENDETKVDIKQSVNSVDDDDDVDVMLSSDEDSETSDEYDDDYDDDD